MCTPSNTCLLRPIRVHIPNAISIGLAVFAHLTHDSVPIVYNEPPLSPSKLSLRVSKLAAFRRGQVTWSQDFRAKWSPPCQYIDTTRKAIDCATTLPLTVFLWSPYVIGRPYIFSCCGLLWPPYVIGGPLYFCPVVSFFFFLSFYLFFSRLISAVGDWMFTILWHMVWPQCEFRMQV